jgi:hypothetical protein
MSRTIRLLDFFRHYQDLPHQRAAVQALQDAMPQGLLQDTAEWVGTYRAATPAKPAQPPEPPKPAANTYQALAPLLALIREGEGGYESINRGHAGDTPGGWVGLTSMTLAEVMAAQKARKVFAVGAYQFIPETLATAVRVAGLPVTMPFSRDAQDWLATVLILGGKRPALRDYLTGKSSDLAAAQLDLAKEWASIPGPNGRGFYDGDSAGNRAHIRMAPTVAALKAARSNLAGSGLANITPPPTSSRLSVTQAEPQFYPQTDNGAEKDRTCFTSAAAMLAKAVKPSALTGPNADWEQYYPLVRKYGDTTDATAQVKALAELGIKARLVKNSDWGLIHEQVKRRGGLALGYIHRGPVSRPDPASNGHWCYCWGIDDHELLIHDPQGEPDMVNGGFVPGRSGRAVRVSRANFGRRWMVTPSPQGWLYTPGTGWALVVDGVS